MSVGDRIRCKRKQMGLTQLALAQKLGVAKAVVSHWENNLDNPDGWYLLNLADIFNVNARFIINGEVTDETNLNE